MSNFSVGQTIVFGRPNGEKTLAKVVKVNRKSIKVETLEARGTTARGQAPKRIWNVSPSLCSVPGPSSQAWDGSTRTSTALDDPRVAAALGKLSEADIDALKRHFSRA